MKRTMGILILATMASVFFTGCNSLLGSMEVDVKEVGTSVAVEEDASRASEGTDGEGNGGARLGYTDEDRNKKAPDYFEQVLEKRGSETGGRQAFELMEGHSEKVSDFQIGGLLEDRTFVYGYATTLQSDPDTLVHCATFYNYGSGDFQVFHENRYRSGDIPEDRESFYLQVCTKSSGEDGEIFVYDNGYGSLYDMDGSLKIQIDLETYVRRQYPNVYSLTITKAMTDGENRIYVELSIEKEMLDISPDENADTEESEEELDKQAELLEQEIEEKVDEVILVYELKDMITDMTQENEAFEAQKTEWAGMTKDQEYEEEPDAEADWAAAVKEHPDSWSGVKLSGYENLPMYQWKGEEKFLYESADGVCTFVAYPDTYVYFTDLKANTELGRVFYAPDGHYSRIYGRAGAITEYGEETITRKYTYVWYEDETDENGETKKVKKTEEKEQTITKTKSRKVPLEQSYTESFWNLNGVSTLGNSLNSSIICTGKDGRVYWIRPGGALEDTGLTLNEDYRVGVITDGSEVCLVASDASYMYLHSDRLYQVEYKSLGGGYESGTSVYDQIFEAMNEESLPESIDVYSGGDYYTEKNVLRVNLELDEELLSRLREKDPDGGWPETGGTRKGFLLTSQSRGLTYYDPGREEGILLANGYWFQSFLLNGKVVSVGFANGDVSYSALDAAHARVYEYDLDALCEAQMNAALNEILAGEEAARIAESESAAAAETETKLEGVEDPMEQWNQDYKEKYEPTLPANGS